LRVFDKHNNIILSLINNHNRCRELLRVYNWFLLRDSEKYDVQYQEGRCIIVRDTISRVVFDKTKK